MDFSNENIIHVKKEGIEYLQFRKLLEYSDIKHAYVIGLDNSFKVYTNPTGDEIEKTEKAKKAYQKICDELKINYNTIVNTKQNHTDNIIIIDKKINQDSPDFGMYEDTDGLITNKEGIALASINADCILLIFYDPIKKVIANVHSGWRGTLQRISVKAIKKMIEEFGCDPKDIICCMSPSIRQDHFEVDKDVYEMTRDEFKDLNWQKESIFRKQENNTEKWNIDTIEINRLILQEAGLKKENIIDSGICSVCHKDIIHSYRAHGKNAGRGTLIISL